VGYDKRTKRLIGTFGPGGFRKPDEPPPDQFQGELAHYSRDYESSVGPYLAFPDGVYMTNFRQCTLKALFVPAAGETVLWANRWQDEGQKRSLAVVGTDRSIHVLQETGSPVLAVPRAYEWPTYQVRSVGRLEEPERYWVWYEPAWYLPLKDLETMPAYVVTCHRAGREVAPRQELPPLAGFTHGIQPRAPLVQQPSGARAWFGLLTSPAEAGILLGTTRRLEDGVRANQGAEVPLALWVLQITTQHFIPGVRWYAPTRPELVFWFALLMVLAAAVCGLACWLLARRCAVSRAQRIGWTLCGLLFGLVGLLLMLALHEWPARVRCPGCRKLRVVTRATCEHCGAIHAAPALDGTEIFEPSATDPRPLLVGHF
jgi:hypothetical protein